MADESSQSSESDIALPACNVREDEPAFVDEDIREPHDEHVSDEEDLFGDNMERDYVPIPELDHYEGEHLDDQSVSEMSIGERIAAEATLRERDRLEGRRMRSRRGLDMFDDMSEADSQTGFRKIKRHRRRAEGALDGRPDLDGDMDTETIDNLEDTRSFSTKDWISQRATKNEIRNRFKNLLKTYVDESGRSVFKEKLRLMSENNAQSFELEYPILAEKQPALALFVVECPQQMFDIFNEAAREVVLSMYPNYTKIQNEIFVRIRDLAISEDIRKLRQVHLNQLIRTQGVVSSATGIIPQLGLVKFDCLKCKYILGPFVQNQDSDIKPGTCPGCQSLGPFAINMEETLFKNYQRITIQESPGKISAGRVPRAKDVIILGDLCDTCRPGDEIDLTGVYINSYDGSLNVATGFPVFGTLILANNVVKHQDWSHIGRTLSDAETRQIVNLAKDPNIIERIYASVCPSIYGHEPVKRAIALALFGGCAKTDDKHRIRGDINVLLCGDPGSAKSQFLKYTHTIAPRAVYTTGQGASAVGLTAYVQKSPVTREWTLEAGALVLADNGVCLIDEFDKMSDQDRTSIHEAMEQQSISVSKAGIVATLSARCAVIAASNPVGGRYNPNSTFLQNVTLTDPIISRFDIICVVRDEVNEFNDSTLAKFIVRSHRKAHYHVNDEELAEIEALDSEDKLDEYEIIDKELLKRYIVYARDRYRPQLSINQKELIAKVYAEMRRESKMTNSMPITARHIESIIRCSEAFAKMRLRDHVTTDDVRTAMKVVVSSFVSTQKYAVAREMKQIFSSYLSYNRSSTEILINILKDMVINEQQILRHKFGEDEMPEVIEIDEREFRNRCRRVDDSDPSYFYRMPIFTSNKFSYDPQKRVIKYVPVAN